MHVCHRQRFMIALHPGTHWSVDSCRTMCQFRQPRSPQLKWRMAEWLQFKMWCPVPHSKQVLFFRELSSPNGSDKVDKVRSSARKLSIFLSKRSANLWRTRPSKRWSASRLAVGWVHQTFKTRCLQLCWQHRKNQEKNPFHRIPFQEPQKKKHTRNISMEHVHVQGDIGICHCQSPHPAWQVTSFAPGFGSSLRTVSNKSRPKVSAGKPGDETWTLKES